MMRTRTYPQLPQKTTEDYAGGGCQKGYIMPTYAMTHLNVHPKVLDDRDTSMAVGGGRKNMELHIGGNRRFGRGANSHFVRDSN